MQAYRIRTEEEFIKKHGENWKQTVIKNFSSNIADAVFKNLGIFIVNITEIAAHNFPSFVLIVAEEAECEAYIKQWKNNHPDIGSRCNLISKDGNYLLKYKYSNLFNINITIVASPTGNCQLASIVSFNNLISYEKDPIEIIRILKTTLNVFGKRLFLVDVNSYYQSIIEKLHPVFMTPYVSTNGSHMLIALLNISK